ARRILQTIEIQHQLARFVESVVRKARVQKTAGTIRGRRAGSISQNEEQFLDCRVFKYGIKPIRLAAQHKFRRSRNLCVITRANQRHNLESFLRIVGNPTRGYAVSRIWFVPLQPVKTNQRRSLGIFDAQSKAVSTTYHVEI